jgi:hypothetical protein
MSKFKEFYQSKIGNINLPAWAGPVLLFVTCFFSFGLLLARLGYFQDDWHHVYYALMEGPSGLMRFLFIDSRPLAFMVYVPFFKLLGFMPAHWHWSLMFLRFLTVLVFWFSVRMVWPNLTGMATWLALFFAIYPAFPLQSLSVAYTLHWFLYFVFMLSVALMLLAARKPQAYVQFTGLAVILQMFHLLMIEYYAGLELIRLVLLWFIFREMPAAERWKKVLKQWLPYLGVLILYAVYRLSYSTLYGYDRFTPTLLIDLVRSPSNGGIAFLQTILQDTIYVLISPWYTAIDPAVIDLSRGSTFAILASIVGFAILGYFVVSRLEKNKTDASHLAAREIVLTGALAVFFGLLPSWLAGLLLFSKNPLWSGRLALPALLGASMVLIGLVYWLVEKPSYRHLVLSILLGIAVGFHAQTARDFQTSWDKQLQLYWQMYWRAPGLKPNTLIVSDAEILPYMGYYPTAYALNVLYDQPPDTSEQPAPAASPTWGKASYWFNAGSEHIDWSAFGHDLPTVFSKYSTTFSVTRQQVVSITFEPQQQQCLWVLRPSYEEIRFLSAEAYRWMSMSNPDRIQPQAVSAPMAAIFGNEPEHTWCYYYEKADLASQQGDWQSVTRLWEQAKNKGYRPRTSVELFPFIEAYARTADWETAQELTTSANVYLPRAQSLLCTMWKKIEISTPSSEQRDKSIKLLKEKLGCQE